MLTVGFVILTSTEKARIKKINTKLIIIVSMLPIISFGTVGITSYYEITGFNEDQKWTQHTHQVIEQSDAIEKSMLNIETGSRGYVITGNPALLEPFNSGISQVKSQIDSIRTLTADNPIEQSNIEKLTTAIEEKIKISSNMVNLTEIGDVASAVKDINSLKGKRTMDEIRQDINNIKNEENNLLIKRADLTQSAAQNTVYVIILGSLIAIAITGITTFTTYRKIQQNNKFERDNIKLHLETEKLKEIDKIKGELSAMVSHELKTPLVVIGGYAEMLREEGVIGNLNKEQRDAVDTINSQVTKLERLISDVLDAQKMDLKRMKYNKKQFEVDKFMDEQIHIHSKIMDDKKTHFNNSTSEKIRLVSDPDRLSQVFANLIKNAVDFVPVNDGSIEINAQNKNGQVIFYVKDNGSGIPKEKQEDLFKKFYQIDSSLKRSHGGTGLGLVICKGIVEALGGKIWIESEVGKGTTIWFSIPANGISQAESDEHT